jgi:hypothetical protein
MGALADVGAAVRDSHMRRVIRSKGSILITSSTALKGLDYQIRNNIPEMVCFICGLHRTGVDNNYRFLQIWPWTLGLPVRGAIAQSG